MKVPVLQNILSANDQIAARNRGLLDEKKVLAINVMSSPGLARRPSFWRLLEDSKPQSGWGYRGRYSLHN